MPLECPNCEVFVARIDLSLIAVRRQISLCVRVLVWYRQDVLQRTVESDVDFIVAAVAEGGVASMQVCCICCLFQQHAMHTPITPVASSLPKGERMHR